MEEKFKLLLKERGFDTWVAFEYATGIHQSNIIKNVRGYERPQLKKLFTYANALGVKLEVLLDIFYEDEMEENRQKACNALDFFDV